MKQAALANSIPLGASIRIDFIKYVLVFCAGLLGPLGFAPFHLPGLTILSMAFLFSSLKKCPLAHGFLPGFFYGLGYFGFGVSWVIVSIHDYGQLNYILAGLLTLLFITYLALFPALATWLFKLFEPKNQLLLPILLFSTLWCISEYLRSSLFTGFPWLICGTSFIDTPVKYLAPIIGLYGMSIVCALSAGLLAAIIQENSSKRFILLGAFVLLIIAPAACKNIHWTEIKSESISIGGVQANLSMRDKWDESLFWDMLKFYEKSIKKLLGKQLIILPESAIPLPASYLDKYLSKLDSQALQYHSALMLGILQPTNDSETHYYNSLITLGQAKGKHLKRQLVPFGEYIPKPLLTINRWLNLPEPNLLPGIKQRPLIKIANYPVASLICYEIAYPGQLRAQMPEAQWIVSISDNGWFGHSLASYQQLQMAQILSLLTNRYQIVVNNDGLSSVIDNMGDITDSLPAFSSGILQSSIHPVEGSTPWILWNETFSFIFCTFVLFFALFIRLRCLLPQ